MLATAKLGRTATSMEGPGIRMTGLSLDSREISVRTTAGSTPKSCISRHKTSLHTEGNAFRISINVTKTVRREMRPFSISAYRAMNATHIFRPARNPCCSGDTTLEATRRHLRIHFHPRQEKKSHRAPPPKILLSC